MSDHVLDPILRSRHLSAATGLSRATIYRLVAEGAFPAPARLSPNSVGWPLSAINKWRKERGLPPADQAQDAEHIGSER